MINMYDYRRKHNNKWREFARANGADLGKGGMYNFFLIMVDVSSNTSGCLSSAASALILWSKTSIVKSLEQLVSQPFRSM